MFPGSPTGDDTGPRAAPRPATQCGLGLVLLSRTAGAPDDPRRSSGSHTGRASRLCDQIRGR
eukprot:753530-Hanusia_phi.AAC.3